VRREAAFWFGDVDLAPVAVFRIALGILSFNWFWQLYPNLTQFFTDEGMFPRSSQVSFFPRHLTFLNAAGEWWQVVLFWVVALGVALALAVGFHSRTAAFMTFVMLGSFSLRNPLIGDASDQVFRASAFWLTFTAAGDRYSVDSWLRARRGDPPSGRGWALPVRVLELQFAWIYLATGLEKVGGGLWRDGFAVFYSLQLEHTFARPWAMPLASNLDLTRLATQLTVVVELAFLPLAFLPYIRRIGRIVAVLSAAGLHLSILLLMNVGNFPFVMLAGLIPFLPPEWVSGTIEKVRLPRAVVGTTAAPVPARRAAPRWFSVARATALVAFALLVFSTSLPAYMATPRPEPVDRMLQYANLLQKWNMFSPDPPTSDGWMRIPAVLADGTRTDLVTGRAPSEEALYADPFYSRWTKVTEWIASSANGAYREEYSRMYCRLRNLHLQPGQSPIVSFDLVYYERKIPAPGEVQALPRLILLNSHHC
jgi:vitamin K-dependent gamma-carboxylase-like protein